MEKYRKQVESFLFQADFSLNYVFGKCLIYFAIDKAKEKSKENFCCCNFHPSKQTVMTIKFEIYVLPSVLFSS